MGIDPSELLRRHGLHVTPNAWPDPPCVTAVEDFGYEIEEAEVIYWGRCAAGDQRSEATV